MPEKGPPAKQNRGVRSNAGVSTGPGATATTRQPKCPNEIEGPAKEASGIDSDPKRKY
jgi:hypothetical protein